MNVCVYVCTYVCMYVYMYVCMYVCMYVYIMLFVEILFFFFFAFRHASSDIARKLGDLAVRLGTSDNVTVIVVRFHHD